MSGEAPGVEMPRYKSHKTVWALEIDTVEISDLDGTGWLRFRDKGYAPMTATAGMFSRYQPIPGDFYVQYEDGYKSFSPRKAFLEGYSREIVMAIQLKPSGSVVTLTSDDHPALAMSLERELIVEKDKYIEGLTAAKDWADFEKRRGMIQGLNAAISICREINDRLKA